MKTILYPASPLVFLIAWGAGTADAVFALQRGHCHARASGYRVHDRLALHGLPMRSAPLADVAARRFIRRHVDYHRAWWLVPCSAVSPEQLAQARSSLRQLWVADAAQGEQAPESATACRRWNCWTQPRTW